MFNPTSISRDNEVWKAYNSTSQFTFYAPYRVKMLNQVLNLAIKENISEDLKR